MRVDSAAAHANPWLTALDIAVGLAFVVAPGAARGPLVERGLIALVGVAWLAGSVLPLARPWHEAALVVALIAFPAGRVQDVTSRVLTAAATIVALGLLSQIGVAAVFAAVAVSAGLRWPREGIAGRFPTVAGAALAGALGSAWLVGRQGRMDPTLTLVAYEVVLLGVAVGFTFAARAVVRAGAALADRLLSGPGVPALEGLAAILGQVLGDATLRIYRWQGSDYVDGRGQRVTAPTGNRRWLYVGDPTGPVAAMAHHSVALDDPPTVEAVSSAVRLAVTHLRLQEEQQSRLRELEEARARIVAATDRQREQIAKELRREIEPALLGARSDLQWALPAMTQPGVRSTLNAVADELSAASALIAGLVAGVPPAHLGDGRLSAALTALAATSPVPVTVTVDDDAVADEATETALFYVCSEALANAIKHSHATKIEIAVRRGPGSIDATVCDDGHGGADIEGSGLQGLADRLATLGGRLRVDSPRGAGTCVTATING